MSELEAKINLLKTVPIALWAIMLLAMTLSGSRCGSVSDWLDQPIRRR